MNSIEKGKRGERELAAVLREFGFDARRGQQFQGGPDSPDVLGLEGFHVECKRREAGNPYTWYEQAVADAGDNIPLVAHRRNGKPWLAILDLNDFLAMVRYIRDSNDDE